MTEQLGGQLKYQHGRRHSLPWTRMDDGIMVCGISHRIPSHSTMELNSHSPCKRLRAGLNVVSAEATRIRLRLELVVSQ